MKNIFSLGLLAVLLLSTQSVCAQTNKPIPLDANTNDTVVELKSEPKTFTDDNTMSDGGYATGTDYHLSVKGGCNAPMRISVYVEELSVDCLDTIYIYDGPTATGTPIVKFNSFTGNVHEGDYIYESPSNTTGFITIRFRTDPRTDSAKTALSCHANNPGPIKGFKLTVNCRSICATPVPVIDDVFYRTRNGVVYDSGTVHMIYVYDTVYNPDGSIKELVEVDKFLGVNLCIGDGFVLKGHGEYSNLSSYYTPTDATSYFHWDMDNNGDTLGGVGLTTIEYNNYQKTGCYDVRLKMEDERGCYSGVRPSIRVRTAINPIKTLYRLLDICSRDSLPVNVGYDGDNATLTLAKILADSAVSKTYESRTFIPDGQCDGKKFFEAPVTFTEFASGRKVEKAGDICSICINMEHSFMGDIYITIVCPNNKEAIIKFGNNSSAAAFDPPYEDPTLPLKSTSPGGETGTSTMLGLPISTYTTTNIAENGGDTPSAVCDSTQNPYGIGLDYCFSRDTGYYLVTNEKAGDVWTPLNPNPTGNFYIGSAGAPKVSISPNFPPIPDGFVNAGTTPKLANKTIQTRRPSKHDEKTDYYLPYTTFSELVGCDLNGTWKVRVYDPKSQDNGWIFSWTMDICDFRANACNYQVAIDSLVWEPDPAPQYHDYDLGHYRGAEVHRVTPLKSNILTPDTAGTFPILVHVYDEFGCKWDTSTTITSYWTPAPDLGPDTSLCGINQMLLDASDRHSDSPDENYSFKWVPYGQTTDTITTMKEPGAPIQYIVEVTNVKGKSKTTCTTRDTILVGSRKQPLPSVLPTPFVFEGCDPFTLEFDNQSINADYHLWDFGDGTTSTAENPVHTFTEGIYDLKYYATSAEGCIDSIISPKSVAVFPSPKAGFSWSPTYPSVTNPQVQFHNETTGENANTRYFWEMQYNLNNPFSVETKVEHDPTFDFTQYTDGNPAGNYEVRLIARSDNLAPSGNMIYCPDTATNNILVVNDFLQFPNVVTPNGDGINDKFEIINLIDGLGFPSNSLDIYNKWGTRVFHIENITNPDDYWDPSNVPSGTYYYRFSARGFNGSIEHNGTVEVVR